MKYQICKKFEYVVSGIEAKDLKDAHRKAEMMKPKDFDFHLEGNDNIEITEIKKGGK